MKSKQIISNAAKVLEAAQKLNSQEMTDYTRLKFRTFLDLMIKNSISGKRVKLVKHVDRYIVSMKEGRLIYKDKELVSVIIFGYDTIEEKEKEK